MYTLSQKKMIPPSIEKYKERFRIPRDPSTSLYTEHLHLLSPDFFFAFQRVWWRLNDIFPLTAIKLGIAAIDDLSLGGNGWDDLENIERYRAFFFNSRPILKCHAEMVARVALQDVNDLVVMFKLYETME